MGYRKKSVKAFAIHQTSMTFSLLLVFTALYLARPEDMVPALGPLHLPELTGILAVLSYIWSYLGEGIRFRWTTELKIMLALTVWFLIGVPFSIWRGGSFSVLTETWFRTLLIFFLFSQTALTFVRVRRLLWVILLCETFVATISVLSSGGHTVEASERLKGAVIGFLSGNEFGIVLAMTMPFLAVFLITCRSLFKTVLVLMAYGILIAMTVLNASRGGIICLVFSSVMILVGLDFRRFLRARLMALLVVVTFFSAAIFAPGFFFERIRTIWGGSDQDHSSMAESARASSAQRSILLHRSVLFTLQHPVFGIGLGNFVVASGTSTGKSYDWIGTHNTFTQVSSEAGIPALFLYVWLFIVAIRCSAQIVRTKSVRPSQEAKEIRLVARASIISLLTFALGAFFVAMAYNLVSFYFFMIPVGLRLTRRWKQSEPPVLTAETTTVVPYGWSPEYGERLG